MNRNSIFYKVIHRYFRAVGRANTFNLFGPKSLSGNFDEVKPVDSRESEPRYLDNSPEAVEKRSREARNSLLVPLTVILGVVIIFAAAIFIKTH